jgi:hypothetical protein
VLEHLLHRAPADAAALVLLGDHEPPHTVKRVIAKLA